LNGAEERKWLESVHERTEDHLFGIALREGERLIGTCGLHGTSLPHRKGELGILIGEKEAQGQGYGAEAIGLLLDYGFGTLGLHRVGLSVYSNNGRGIRCYEKCGFRREGVLREARWWAGRWWDILEFAILDHEWHAAAAGEARREKASLSPRNAAK
jgi:RimJ/RimL family protein N-acetyltransferase